MPNFLVQPLPTGSLDIIGDVHGELQALQQLIQNLGYQEDGSHPEQRSLIFVGDYCDRGPNSPAVIEYLKSLINNNKAKGILGNHEINLLIDDAKDGSGWYFDQRYQSDLKNYSPFKCAKPQNRDEIRKFLSSLPIALERSDLRIVHAAWNKPAIDAIRSVKSEDFLDFFFECERKADNYAEKKGILNKYLAAKQEWKEKIEDPKALMPLLQAYIDYDLVKNDFNPIRLLTSGTEGPADRPFFAGNRWRFSDRTPWWNSYQDDIPVVFGHYWRQLFPQPMAKISKYSLLFKDIDPFSWHGAKKNTFCVDFSVGARWRDRRKDQAPEDSAFHLAALRWPEKIIMTDTGFTQPTR
ncbi:hypothetical protein BVZ31_16715 [Alcaligenes faecalis]|uniref:metallophosphoesterase n=1 Tax=Alcaligenes faecalis TaxID=511 RepID=UPI000A2DFDA0|nr:metallophosphoesterase [Alcaligenes faecalis]OSZ42173.1 hypothetical protein BVZ30_13995 [Alcaligenes faecalis]OSZ48121.1 hypothetical protein BVZ31_16715 [Alcaligenes faecalis]OSZ49593.1 hypothetical protein BVZ32_17470 [Alcaligenes faecalis]